ncbi:retrotransposon protein, putative, ty1-copia subclass [Tanacetum coccineum]
MQTGHDDLQWFGHETSLRPTPLPDFEIGRLSVVVVRPVNTRHRWDETCLLDIIVIKSTDVVGMALPVQNINHSAFRSMFEKEKLSGNNFNDWFARLKLVLRVEKKMHVIEQPLPPAPEAGAEPNIVAQWTALYDAHTEIACLMLGSMTPELHRQFELHYPYDMIQELRSMFEKQAGVEKFDLIQSFHACKQEEGKSVADYVLKMKGYVEQLERLGYMLPQDISVGLILNGLTKDFVGFVRNYNMHNMGKTIGEIHAMLIEYEKGLPKKAENHIILYESPAKDDAATTVRSRTLEKGTVLCILLSSEEKEASWLAVFQGFRIKRKLIQESSLLLLWAREFMHKYWCRSMMNLTTLPLSFWDYALESATRILNMVPTKKVDKTTNGIVLLEFPYLYQHTYDYEIWKWMFKITFLNGYLDEDIYMVQPEGFVDPNHPKKVCKLQRSIYGLKQASRSGYKDLMGNQMV